MGPGGLAPFRSGPFGVRPEWIDENGHLNLAYYVVLFDWATDALWVPLGLGAPLRAGGRGTFAVETHTLYAAELVAGEQVVVDSLVLGVDGKRLHVAHEMRRAGDGVVSARQELLFLCVDLAARRAAGWPDGVVGRVREWVAGAPDWVGRRVGLP